MKIFKSLNVSSDKKADKFIGFYVDENTDVLLTLCTIHSGFSKSSLLRRILSDWSEGGNIISALAKKAYMIWELEWRMKSSIKEFKVNVEQDLYRKGIPVDTVRAIIKEVDILMKDSGKVTKKRF